MLTQSLSSSKRCNMNTKYSFLDIDGTLVGYEIKGGYIVPKYKEKE